jgi:post-segregation antitoxin (ccd killing protein)
MKTCQRCRQALDEHLFGKNRNQPDGLQTWCKACKSLYHQQTYTPEKRHEAWLKNRSKSLQRMAEKHALNPTAGREKAKAWRIENPEKRAAAKKRSHASRCKSMSDGYIKERLIKGTNLTAADIPKELIDVKREQLRILRELRKEDHEER